jgi:hypothetical protein
MLEFGEANERGAIPNTNQRTHFIVPHLLEEHIISPYTNKNALLKTLANRRYFVI